MAGLWILGPLSRGLSPHDAPRVSQFAVGQGDCGLVAFPDGWLGLIDTAGAWGRADSGPLTANVIPWLERQGVRRLDAVVLTHGHLDHTGGAEALAARLEVALWLGGGRAGATVATGSSPWQRTGRDPVVLHRWRDWTLTVIDPGPYLSASAPENDRSLVTVLTQGDRAEMVWSGDLEEAGERALLAAGLVPDGARVWKAGHHGSNTSGSRAFLERLAPAKILISCGVANRHGHPSHGPYVVGTDTAAVWRTDLQGSLAVDWEGTEVRVSALRRPLGRFP